MKEKTLAYKIEELKKMLPDGNPVGITFKTQNGYYYYDTVTGKVLACQKVEYEIIEKRYFKGQTQTEIASELAISQAQVSRIEKSALQNLKKNF